MPEIVPFPSRMTVSDKLSETRRSGRPGEPPQPADRLEQITSYGSVGPLSVALVRRIGAMAGLVHVVVTGPPTVGVETVATLADDAGSRSAADFTGAAVLRALELAETAFTCRPEAC